VTTNEAKRIKKSVIFLNILNSLKGKDTAFYCEIISTFLGFIIY
jgi:hypothetical protein